MKSLQLSSDTSKRSPMNRSKWCKYQTTSKSMNSSLNIRITETECQTFFIYINFEYISHFMTIDNWYPNNCKLQKKHVIISARKSEKKKFFETGKRAIKRVDNWSISLAQKELFFVSFLEHTLPWQTWRPVNCTYQQKLAETTKNHRPWYRSNQFGAEVFHRILYQNQCSPVVILTISRT